MIYQYAAIEATVLFERARSLGIQSTCRNAGVWDCEARLRSGHLGKQGLLSHHLIFSSIEAIPTFLHRRPYKSSTAEYSLCIATASNER